MRENRYPRVRQCEGKKGEPLFGESSQVRSPTLCAIAERQTFFHLLYVYAVEGNKSHLICDGRGKTPGRCEREVEFMRFSWSQGLHRLVFIQSFRFRSSSKTPIYRYTHLCIWNRNAFYEALPTFLKDLIENSDLSCFLTPWFNPQW